jgi:hypothetical protein
MHCYGALRLSKNGPVVHQLIPSHHQSQGSQFIDRVHPDVVANNAAVMSSRTVIGKNKGREKVRPGSACRTSVKQARFRGGTGRWIVGKTGDGRTRVLV